MSSVKSRNQSGDQSSGAGFFDQHKDRQAWMGVLARTPKATLESFWQELADRPEYGVLRAPETGMVMVRGRAGGEGARFNLGEMTVTRCVVRTTDGRMGQSYVAGRDHRHAELAALFDALLQDPERRALLKRELIEPAENDLRDKRAQDARKVATTKVDFFTMVRGDD
ncbi:phosphonate C-P lyase system protein PhnG [Magnetovibrio sp.]|uniref:phosphonate C-P lyase system protein PhnG n=1 Tax=Magnetovibrio sp. TaxID=2024836 RepID=UPI002F94EE98